MKGIVLLGPPGVGKGTQAQRLRDSMGLLHLSTGDVLRQEVAAGTSLGLRVKEVMASGALVSDDLVGEVVASALAKGGGSAKGCLFDGFPRTVAQVGILDVIAQKISLDLTHVLFLEAPEAVLVRRLSGRRVCSSCNAVFHVDGNPPKTAGTCDSCGGALAHRPDDCEGVVAERLDVYRRLTEPVIEAYERRGLLRRIEGTGTPSEVFARIQSVVGRVSA